MQTVGQVSGGLVGLGFVIMIFGLIEKIKERIDFA
jgi:hypothetical protein